MRTTGTLILGIGLALFLSACGSVDVGRVIDAPCPQPERPPADVSAYKPRSTSYQASWGDLLQRETSSLATPIEKRP